MESLLSKDLSSRLKNIFSSHWTFPTERLVDISYHSWRAQSNFSPYSPIEIMVNSKASRWSPARAGKRVGSSQ